MNTIVITGSREWTDWKQIERALIEYLTNCPLENKYPMRLIEGGALGADRIARDIAKNTFSMEVVTIEADWDTYGRAAGMKRNIEMLEDYDPNIVLAFPKKSSKGTVGCIKEAIKREIPIKIYYESL